jgi:hypothetical protein
MTTTANTVAGINARLDEANSRVLITGGEGEIVAITVVHAEDRPDDLYVRMETYLNAEDVVMEDSGDALSIVDVDLPTFLVVADFVRKIS